MQQNTPSHRFLVETVMVCTLLLLAILPIPHTIGVRHLLLGLLCVIVLANRQPWQHLRPLLVPIGLWAAYLLIYPLISPSPAIAWNSFSGQWSKSLLAMLAGAGAGLMLREHRWSNTFTLGVVSAVPLIVHILLTVGVWFGWVSADFGSWGGTGDPPRALLSHNYGTIAAFPWSYWGIEQHHADLGYAALQTGCLIGASYVTTAGGKQHWRIAGIIALCLISLISLIVAQSRAGLVFFLLALASMALVFQREIKQHDGWNIGLRQFWIGSIVVGIVLAVIVTSPGSHWAGLADRLLAGTYGDPVKVLCEGSRVVENDIQKNLAAPDERVAQNPATALEGGDGVRTLLLRTGLILVTENPLGIDGSKEAFQRALRKHCSQPVIDMSHAHDGWIDLTLALGWPGGVLYLLLLTSFAVLGFRTLRSTTGHKNEWGAVLAVLSVLWILRGFTDSVFRDHMLAMQGFMLAFAAARALSQERNMSARR